MSGEIMLVGASGAADVCNTATARRLRKAVWV